MARKKNYNFYDDAFKAMAVRLTEPNLSEAKSRCIFLSCLFRNARDTNFRMRAKNTKVHFRVPLHLKAP